MARPLRIEYPGAWYHVMNRGLGRRKIFLSDPDRKSFLHLLEEISKMFQLEVHAYSLLDNHYHLLVHTPQGNLGRIMRHLNGIYTQRFNRRHQTDGPLFRGRYKAILVDKDTYLLELVRYIHLNPVRAALCHHPQDHRWTSHRAYLQRASRPLWLKTEEVLGRFGSQEKQAQQELQAFVQAGIPEAFQKTLIEQGVAIGSPSFWEWIYTHFVERQGSDREIPFKEKRRVKDQPSPTQILSQVAAAYGISATELYKSERGKENEAREVAIYLLRNLLGLSQKEAARWMNCPTEYTVATIYKRFKVKLLRDPRLKERVDRLKGECVETDVAAMRPT